MVRLNRDAVLSGGWDQSFTAQPGTSVIDGEAARYGIEASGGVVTIERFTVQNTLGGILNGGRLALTSSAVINNVNASDGYSTGISNWGVLVLEHCRISSNTGIGIANSGALILDDSIVSGNTIGHGIYNEEDAIAVLTRSAITDNRDGGGIRNDGTLVLRSSTVSGNTGSGSGAGIWNVKDLILENSTVSGNTAGTSGGGISNGYSAKAYLYNSTVAANTAPAGGGVDVSATGPGALTAQNTIIAGNSGGDCTGTLTSTGYNLVGSTAGCTFTPAAGDQTNVDPQLGPLEGVPGWHPLLDGSPAIEAGNPAGCTDHAGQRLLTDQRGFPRFGRCDIGAYEWGEVRQPVLAVDQKVMRRIET